MTGASKPTRVRAAAGARAREGRDHMTELSIVYTDYQGTRMLTLQQAEERAIQHRHDALAAEERAMHHRRQAESLERQIREKEIR